MYNIFPQKNAVSLFTVYKFRCVCNMPACLEMKKTQKRERIISKLKNEMYDVKFKKYIEHLHQMLTVLPNFPRPLNAMITKIQYLLTE